MIADIVIVAPAGADSAFVDAMVVSCQAAIGESRCALPSPDVSARWVASVSWTGDRQSTGLVEFRASEDMNAIVATRQLAFGPGDPPRIRWASVGLVIAAFAADHGGERVTASPPMEPLQPVRPAAVPTLDHSSRWGVDAAALGGPSFDSGPYRFGGFVHGWLQWASAGANTAMVGAGVRYSQRLGSDPSVAWWAAYVGAVLRVGADGAQLAAELEADAMLEYAVLRAQEFGQEFGQEGSGARTSSAAEWEFGGRVATQAVLRLSSVFSGFVGAEILITRPRLVVEIGGAPVGTEPLANVGVFAGVRFAK
jgi:hypothetical protein